MVMMMMTMMMSWCPVWSNVQSSDVHQHWSAASTSSSSWWIRSAITAVQWVITTNTWSIGNNGSEADSGSLCFLLTGYRLLLCSSLDGHFCHFTEHTSLYLTLTLTTQPDTKCYTFLCTANGKVSTFLGRVWAAKKEQCSVLIKSGFLICTCHIFYNCAIIFFSKHNLSYYQALMLFAPLIPSSAWIGIRSVGTSLCTTMSTPPQTVTNSHFCLAELNRIVVHC